MLTVIEILVICSYIPDFIAYVLNFLILKGAWSYFQPAEKEHCRGIPLKEQNQFLAQLPIPFLSFYLLCPDPLQRVFACH